MVRGPEVRRTGSKEASRYSTVVEGVFGAGSKTKGPAAVRGGLSGSVSGTIGDARPVDSSGAGSSPAGGSGKAGTWKRRVPVSRERDEFSIPPMRNKGRDTGAGLRSCRSLILARRECPVSPRMRRRFFAERPPSDIHKFEGGKREILRRLFVFVVVVKAARLSGGGTGVAAAA
jgi:hypothetical protein